MDSFSPSCCSGDGGEEMVITGSNISTQSKVVFLEKGPGRITLSDFVKCPMFVLCLNMMLVFFLVSQMEDHFGKWRPDLYQRNAPE